jgi:hypothetical protein
MHQRIRRTLAVALAGVALAGCAGRQIGTAGYFAPGSSTMKDVAARMGSPSSVWFDDQGRENWDYSGNQASYFGYRATFDDAGNVLRWRELRTERDVNSLVAGKSTTRDVHVALGEPNELFFIRGEPHWRWRTYFNTRPHYLVAQMGQDGVLKSVMRFPIDGASGRGR